MKKHPEYMILVAIGVALLAVMFASVVSCATLTSAISNIRPNVNTPGTSTPFNIPDPGNNGGGNNGNNGNNGGNSDNNNGNNGNDSNKPGGSDQLKVPESMEIEVDELQDDLGAVINADITQKLGLSDSDKVTVISP